MKKKTLLIYLLLLISLCSMPVCSASEDEIAELQMHESPDGTLSFFAQRSSRLFSSSIFYVLELHKIIASDKTYYAIRVCVGKPKAYETPIQNVVLKLDGIDYQLKPLEGARKDELQNTVQGWYSVPDELLAKLNNTTEWSMKITYTNGKSRDVDQDDNFIKAVKRLKSITKENYATQKAIFHQNNAFTIFIPGVKPEAIIPSIIYNLNYETKNKKDELKSDYYEVALTSDNKFLSFYNVISGYSGIYFCGWVTLVPQSNGTWVTLDLVNNSRYTGLFRLNLEKDIGNMNYFRADDVMNAIKTTYNNFHGSYDYGLTWEPAASGKDLKSINRAKWSYGPLKINNVNSKLFPELEAIKIGDIITEINGVSTQTINYIESLSRVLYTGEKTTFVIKDPQGNQKTVSITPKFKAAELPTKNYSQILANDKRQYTKIDIDQDYPFVFSRSYNPLGEGPQLGAQSNY